MVTAAAIDLSRLPAPNAIEALDYEALLAAFKSRFAAAWAAAREIDPTLPDYDVSMLETDPAVIIGEAWSYLRLLDRARVNDAVKAVLAPLATGADLDNVVARRGIVRLEITPATGTATAVMESDAQLLRRYLLAFDRPSAGSADRYLYEVYSVFPTLQDARVNGFAVHGRRGDVDIVVLRPAGRLLTETELNAIRAAINAAGVKPEATSVTVINAVRALYTVSLNLLIGVGPDPEIVRAEATAKIAAVTTDRMIVGGEVPLDLISGAAYVPGVLRVTRDAPKESIAVEPYRAPVMAGISIIVTK